MPGPAAAGLPRDQVPQISGLNLYEEICGRPGFKQVMNVTGGFDAWLAQKLPVVVEKPASTCTV